MTTFHRCLTCGRGFPYPYEWQCLHCGGRLEGREEFTGSTLPRKPLPATTDDLRVGMVVSYRDRIHWVDEVQRRGGRITGLTIKHDYMDGRDRICLDAVQATGGAGPMGCIHRIPATDVSLVPLPA